MPEHVQTVVPPRLRRGDTLRVIAPARSRTMVMEHDNTRWIDERFAAMGLTLTFGEHVDEDDQFRSSTVEHRVADLHAAFADPSVAGILTVIGGFNSNELLPYLDFDLIAANPKVFCGYSDITALQNAILARTGLVTYSGPHWSSWGMRDHFEPTGDWFRAAVTDDAPIVVEPSAAWTDDLWFADQDARTPVPNEGWWPLRPGRAAGRVVGGNLSTLALLHGTPYLPSLDGALLFLEDDFESDAAHVARHLTALLQQPGADGVAGLVIGRFQASSGVTREALDEIVARQPALRGKPVLAGVDFGHTSPLLTLPVGGTAEVAVGPDEATLTITRH
ncbi:LD-carboxypeptidase [Promicromonospora sp. NPDC050880]|uniref:LD-carboxypeptidase n=1 Tax=Promicromonospora sp. NPDC050880 TaxID=3364406 RepID=UPI0037AD7005